MDNEQMVPLTTRECTLVRVAEDIAAVRQASMTLVAVDGVDGAGKTHFADELEGRLQQLGTTVVRASVDWSRLPPSTHAPAAIAI